MPAMPSVTNLVGLLSLRAPQQLQQLSRRYPDSKILKPGTIMGAAQVGDVEVLLAVTLDALKVLQPLIEPTMQKLQAKLNNARWLQLAGELAGALGSSGVIVAWFGQQAAKTQGSTAAITAAIIALAGSATALFVRFFRQDFFGTENAGMTQYLKLRDSSWLARVMLARLEAFQTQQSAASDSEALRKLIQEADSLAADVYKTLKDLGVPVAL